MARALKRKVIFGLLLSVISAHPLIGDEGCFAYGSVVELELRTDLLADLGLTVYQASAIENSTAALKIVALEAASGGVLALRTQNHVFQGFGSGALRSTGDFALDWRGGRVDFSIAELRTEASSLALELVATDGTPIFDVDHLHLTHDTSRGLLRLFNGDLRLTPIFAQRIGKEQHAGLAVGVLELTAFVPPPLLGGEPPPCPDPGWDLAVDVALSNIDSVGPGAREEGARVVVLPSASLENVGEAAIPWYRRLTGSFAPFANDQHPYLVWNLYRLSSGRLEQIGRSAVKHAFHTINVGCAAPYDGCSHPQFNNIFWPTCRDVYGESTNSRLRNLGPREELDPLSGEWQACGSLADRNCDGEEDEILTPDPFAQQMTVQEEDLETPGARYFLEAWYLVRGDIDIFNSMGHREIAPDDGSGVWAFPFLSQFRQGPAVDSWVSPTAGAEAVDTTLYAGHHGHLKLAVRTRQLGGGRFRYEYAAMNLDLSAGIDQLQLAFAPWARVLAIDFTDADDDPSNDWSIERGPRSLRWKAPEGHPLPWGTLFRFGLTTDVPPSPSTAVLRLAEGTQTIGVETLAPAPALEGLFPEGRVVSTSGD